MCGEKLSQHGTRLQGSLNTLCRRSDTPPTEQRLRPSSGRYWLRGKSRWDSECNGRANAAASTAAVVGDKNGLRLPSVERGVTSPPHRQYLPPTPSRACELELTVVHEKDNRH